MVRAAKKAGMMVVLDVRKDDLVNSIDYRPDVIMPNLSEFLHTFFTPQKLSEAVDDQELLESAMPKMEELYSVFGITSVLTRGGKPTLFINDGRLEQLEPPKLEPVNTIGCGDAFTAGFTHEFMRGASVQKAVESGQKYAVINARLLRPGVIR
jgi:1-phosphofructokinase/tagatose 6-phosphate kinase